MKTDPRNAPFLMLSEVHALANEVREVKAAVLNSRLQLASIEKRLFGIVIVVMLNIIGVLALTALSVLIVRG